ncbi:MAG: hypothetical protein GY820_34375, partial [Gammaproteobacteria bacterium]|nr:hypothetical protein [Gammaproteobacteria bacterium]
MSRSVSATERATQTRSDRVTKAELITAFIAAKEAEADAKATRAALGTELAELLGHPTE